MLQDVTGQKQAETRIKRLNRVYAVLSGINGLIVRAPEPDELFRESCRIAVEHGGFTAAWAGLVDRAAMEVRPVAWQGVDEDHVLAVPRSLDEASSRAGIIGQAVRDRRAIISNDMENDARLLLGARAAALGSRSLVALPLVVGGETLGVLVLHSREKGFFDDQEMKLLLELAGDIAFALDHNEKGRKLDYLAYYDSLTGLANRTLFNERLQQTIAEAGSGRAALFLIDIERFKTINDTFGRQSGDALLKQVAERMVRYGGGGARMGRIGADQFATMVTDFESEERLARFTEKRQSQVFGAPFKVGDQEVRLAARVGIALYPENGADPEALQASAEAALLKAKAGGERYLFFAPEMTARVAETLALENKLRVALEKEEFVLHYQPKVDLETGRIAGLEALIRWQSPELGLVPPGHFIPLLEETGLILQVGSWALARAARDHRAWTEQKLSPPRVAVNVSPIQLRQRDFVAVVKQAIRDGVAPSAIDLEITESLIMQDVQANIEKLNAVRSLGLDIAIDDFGTGYSSLGYLAKLPVQTLKIDRSFIIAMNQDPNAMTLVSTIIALAHSLRLRVVAEGVETEKQAKFLRLLRCEEMQGYLFSKPLPAAEIAAMLRKQAQGEPARADLSGG
jgi:diguanylate cyclase (GGDEF)-like protein